MTADPLAKKSDPGTPGVIARPPLLLLGALLLGFGLDHLAPLPRLIPGLAWPTGSAPSSPAL